MINEICSWLPLHWMNRREMQSVRIVENRKLYEAQHFNSRNQFEGLLSVQRHRQSASCTVNSGDISETVQYRHGYYRPVKAKFHYTSWFGAGSELVRSWFEAAAS